MAEIHFHIERPGPRSRYIIPHMLGTMAGWEAVEIPDIATFRSTSGPKLSYGKFPVEGAFHVESFGFLEQMGTGPIDPGLIEVMGLPLLFPTSGTHLPFDVFSAAFFALTRYEEYGQIDRDAHGRPLSDELHAVRHHYFNRPIVDEWLYVVADLWRKQDPRLPALRRKYEQVATMDVDNGAMYLGRPWWRSLGAAARDLLKVEPRRVLDRAAVLAGIKLDPYAVHQAFLECVQSNGGQAIFNFLTAGRGTHDHAIAPEHPYMHRLMRDMAAHAEVGLHPGYSSSDEPERLALEKQRMEAVIEAPVTRSRQHFLRLRMPETLRELERLGIREEHSMGSADRSGFRAGTCTAFPFYDLLAEETTTLMLHPFAVMDSALCYKMGLSPEAAVKEAQRMVDAVRRVQGTFISVWHERFLSDYGDEAGWGCVAEAVIPYARP